MFARLPAEAPRALAAMRAHPYLVAGVGRLCTSVMRSLPNVVVKVGAEGLLCGVLIEDGIGFALKARDGAARGREVAAVRVLGFLGALGHDEEEGILSEVVPHVLGGAGRQPELRCRGALQSF
jgi:L-asparaginase II